MGIARGREESGSGHGEGCCGGGAGCGSDAWETESGRGYCRHRPAVFQEASIEQAVKIGTTLIDRSMNGKRKHKTTSHEPEIPTLKRYTSKNTVHAVCR